MHENNLPLTPAERNDYIHRVQQAVNTNPIQSDLFGFAGRTETGGLTFHSNSFRQGFQDVMSLNRSRQLETDWFLVGWLSDGTVVFPYSYRQGAQYGMQRLNELKMSVLAEGQRRLAAESESLRQAQQNDHFLLEQALEKIRNLEIQNQELKTRFDESPEK